MALFFISKLKKNLFLVVVGFSSINSHAQAGHIHFQANAITGFSKSKSLNNIIELYNKTNSSYISKNLNRPLLTYGYEFQVDYRVTDRLYTAVGFTNANSKCRSKFPNNTERHLFLRSNYINGLIGISMGDYNELTVFTGFDVNFSLVNSYVKFSNGDKDHITGQLGGSYTSVGFGVPIGAHYAMSISPNFQFLAKVQLFVISATKFTYVNNTRTTGLSSSSLMYQDLEAVDDSKRMLISLGLRYSIN
jgi:hypothetical protein